MVGLVLICSLILRLGRANRVFHRGARLECVRSGEEGYPSIGKVSSLRSGEAELHCPGSGEGELDSTKAERGETHARKVGRGGTP